MAEHECTCTNCGGRDRCKIKFEPSRKCCCFWKPELKPIWIPCSERLPENRERVLVCFRSGTVHIAVWYGDYDEKGAWKVTSQFPTKLYRTDTIPKWMPMPDDYEPEKEDENE